MMKITCIKSFFGLGAGIESYTTMIDKTLIVYRAVHWKLFLGPIIISGNLILWETDDCRY